jgi:hypothetical protein
VNLTRRGALGLSIGAVAALTGQGALARPEPVGPGPVSLDIAARPIPALLARAPGQTRFGALAFRGGLVLSAREAAFGGFSGLWRSDDGQRIVAVSDNAHWLTARLQREGGQLAGLTDAVLAPMLGAGGRPLSRTRSYDTEGLAMAGGVAYVGVERSHEVLRFDWAARGVAARGQPMALPAEARQLPRNRGLEAIGVAPAPSPVAGAVVAISERSAGHDEPTLGLILGGAGPGRFRYRLQDGYEVTDLAFLPQGDMLVLERWYRPWRGLGMRLRRVPAAMLLPGALVEGALLADLDLAHEIDNMEGLAVHQEQGRTILTVISDDNFSMIQRTVLLEFELVG